MRIVVRPATEDDLPALTDIYNYYVVNTPITFDLQPFTVADRREWFVEHSRGGRHRLIVAGWEGGGAEEVAGYASTSRFRPRAAYDTTVEASVYCRANLLRRGIGTALYRALFELVKD